ncbi:MAG: lytic transglycosylase domain-containing protein [Rhizomicrobium sp.]
MAGIVLLAACVLCSEPAAAAPPLSVVQADQPLSPSPWQTFVDQAARQFGIPDAWIRGVMQAESGGRTVLRGKPITSVKGAMGLMQIMPETYRALRAQYGLGDNAYDPRDNIFAGAAYLRQMYERFGYPSLFAAYNAGPRRLDDFLLRGQPLPRETLRYVQSIVPGAEVALSTEPGATPSLPLQNPSPAVPQPPTVSLNALFFLRADTISGSSPPAQATPSPSQTNDHGGGFAAPNSAGLFVPLSGLSR